MSKIRPFPPDLLIDTWWYGLSPRLNDEMFLKLAQRRQEQGFNGIQLVAGIPPEIGVYHPDASGAWDLNGIVNPDYLNHVVKRISLLNSLGFTVIVYGAWGQQIEWLGVEKMKRWWSTLIEHLDTLNVIYCLTGESNLWLQTPNILLPDKSTDQLNPINTDTYYYRVLRKIRFIALWRRLLAILRPIKQRIDDRNYDNRERVQKWSAVLAHVHGLTDKPIIIHTTPHEVSHVVVNNPELLSAITVQTGHSHSKANALWQQPLQLAEDYVGIPYINLEPWYEGILDDFGTSDQLFAFWATMLAGAHGYCYGAHGIWNVGDGKFLAHWGAQTLSQAMNLNTPTLLGKSQQFFLKHRGDGIASVDVQVSDNQTLLSIERQTTQSKMIFYPRLLPSIDIASGLYFSPLQGTLIDTPLANEPLVVVRSS
jgi:hypothetical protein